MKQPYLLLLILVLAACAGNEKKESNTTNGISPDSARIIARDAWVYGYPVFYNYKAMYLYAKDKSYPDNAGGFNKFKHYAKIFTDADTSVVTPNDDTPYSWAALNLADEPQVLEVPAIAGKRYYVMQLVDLFTFNYAYIGSRAIGNKAGKYLLAGPDWKGTKPEGIDSVLTAESNLVIILGRTELLNNADMGVVKKIQSEYKLSGLHEFTKTASPSSKNFTLELPVWKEAEYPTIEFIPLLNALLQYASVNPSEKSLYENFAKIGIEPGKKWDSSAYSTEVLAAIREGIQDGENMLKESIDRTTSSVGLFGTRTELKNDYLKRATAAAMGLYGNSAEEAVYVGSMLDNEGKPLTGDNNYVIKFTSDQLPPVKYFWSLTMYELPKRYLVKNDIGRYSIGDRSKGLKYEKNGDLILYLQSKSPGKQKESNWLPSPANGAPFNFVVRLYGPMEAVSNGSWKLPQVTKVN